MPASTDGPPKPSSLKDELSTALPEGFQCKARYIHTPPRRCPAIFTPPPSREPEVTRLASHFLAVTIASQADSTEEAANAVFVYGVEALVYTTRRLTTIFVSKADSSGYLSPQKPSPIKTITTTFLTWLSQRERSAHPDRTLVISLFARSQTQYLFPGSAENVNKHVLDDRQLIKWWTRVLDPLFSTNRSTIPDEFHRPRCDGYVTVPGYEKSEMRSFLPPSNYSGYWHAGDPLIGLAASRGIAVDVPMRCILPRFPDDPKARFMQNMDDEAGFSDDLSAKGDPYKPGKSGNWLGVRNLAAFWEYMSFRQECSSGRLVGFIWVVVQPEILGKAETVNDEQPVALPDSQDSSASMLSSDAAIHDTASVANGSSPSKQRRKPLTGPIVSRQPRLKGGSSSLTNSDLGDMLNNDLHEGLSISHEGYDKAIQNLLHLDFANLDVATRSTSKWIAEVSQACGRCEHWALQIIGTAKFDAVASHVVSNGVGVVNDLGGMIRKKRKADVAVGEGDITAGVQAEASSGTPTTNILGSGLVRKKPKPTL